MEAEFERLVYEAALRGLDKQERLVEELRARTSVLLAASSLATLVLGGAGFQHPQPLAIAAISAFVVSIGSAVFVLVPRKDLAFTERARGIYGSLFDVRDDMAEVYRRLAWELDGTWTLNDAAIVTLTRAYQVAAGALGIEVVVLSALLLGASVG